MSNCEHEWVDMKDGTRDQFCLKCSNKAKQNVMYVQPTINIDISLDKDKTTIETLAKEMHKEVEKNIRRK